MNKPMIALIALGAAAGATVLGATQRPAGPQPTPVLNGGTADAAHPAVVELFQSQGCSSCPPANVVLNSIANRPDVLALNFSVTYWDDLGWKDSFGQQAFTDRQRDYAAPGRPGQVQTPQMIINGRGAVLGSYKPQVEAAIATYGRGTGGPAITASGATVNVGAGARHAATIWLVDYDPRAVPVAIRAGENGGRTLIHRNIVHHLTALGGWNGAAANYHAAPLSNGLARAVLIQDGRGGPIIAAARI